MLENVGLEIQLESMERDLIRNAICSARKTTVEHVVLDGETVFSNLKSNPNQRLRLSTKMEMSDKRLPKNDTLITEWVFHT